MHTSPPALSCTPARLRRILGDPRLVRAGRNLVPTPRALELRSEVSALVQQARTLLTPRVAPDPRGLDRAYTIQADDGVLVHLVAPLTAKVRAEAPGVLLRFLPDSLEGTSAMRDGRVDVELGVVEHTDPETVVECSPGSTSSGSRRRGIRSPRARSPRSRSPRRTTWASPGAAGSAGRSTTGWPSWALPAGRRHRPRLRRGPDHLPGHRLRLPGARAVRHRGTGGGGPGDVSRALQLPPIELAMAWHPRHTADGGHRRLRECIRQVVTAVARR
ncbi:LysR family transcriptional regulator [Pseudonocardia thermophila]|uniref:LysR family transcriptional regulator n=1 Tax=Pseudonocardia thermophila TaxID=1848 RepID=UPI000AC124AA|nr:LysR family transcriptional regulator [Pseudonocardia thermophila]